MLTQPSEVGRIGSYRQAFTTHFYEWVEKAIRNHYDHWKQTDTLFCIDKQHCTVYHEERKLEFGWKVYLDFPVSL